MDLKAALLTGALQLTSGEIGEEPFSSQTATTYDGTSHEISQFYEPKNDNIKLGGHYSTPKVIYHFNVDTGHDTPKYNKKPTLGLGYQNKDWLFYFELGGDETHTPCFDSFNREYYCRTLTAWSDSKPDEHDDNSIFIKRTFKF